jgi:iron complex transport system substrate-binding protein
MGILLLVLFAESSFAKPARIVSINLCTDQLLMMLAERDRITSVSYLAADPQVSAMHAKAAGLKKNHGMAEEILMLKPDMILAGSFTSRPTIFLLKRLGYPVVELSPASNIEAIQRNIRQVAEAIGEQQKGRHLINEFNRRLPSTDDTAEARPVAAIYLANNFTPGDQTLSGAVLKTAGFTNLAARMGISGTGHLSLESLVYEQPDFIVRSFKGNGEQSVAGANFRHPAFNKMTSTRETVQIADHLWTCGNPTVIDAIEQLVRARETWQRTH